MKTLSEGAEAKIYSATIFNVRMVIKKRYAKPYRVAPLDLMLRRTRTKKEARIMSAAKNAGVNVPSIYAVGKDEIYMEFIEGRLMRDVVLDKAALAKAGIELAKLHKIGIAHGDFTPANIMLSNGKVWVIDFGLAEPNAGIEEKAIDLLLMKRSLPKDFYQAFVTTYASAYTDSGTVIRRLEEIEKRGRYQVRTVANV